MAETLLLDAPVPENLDKDSQAQIDVELVAAINGGDPSAFERLYFRHRDWVLRLACRFTRDPDMALDVMQETFLYLLRKFPGFRLTANLKTFLYPAVRNLSIAAREKTKRFQASEAEIMKLERAAAPSGVPPAALADLNAVVSHLPEEHRETLLLRFVDGLSLADIAEVMNVPLGTVKSRLHNALTSLRADARTKEFFER